MKKIILLSLCFVTALANAQSINLENGKTIKITTHIVTTGESPMGGESKSEMTTTNTIKIIAVEDKMYKATNTTTRMTMNGETMGQPLKFDSEVKEDMDGQMGQMLGSSINKPMEVSIDKADGKVTELAVEKAEGTMGDMMGAESNSTESAFFVIPAGKKVGDKWTLTTEGGGIKIIKNYELQSVKDNFTTVAISSTNKGTTTKEANGMSMEMTMDGKANGTFIVDTKTGLVKQLSMDHETTGSMEMMGQSIPLNNKSKITVTFE